MIVVGRNFVGGYYLLEPHDPPKMHGIEYHHAVKRGMVGDREFTYIPFSPDLFDDTQGKNQESFELSGIAADEIANHPLFIAAAMGQELTAEALESFAPSARERILASMAEGMDAFDAAMTHIARLIPEYCGATFAECIEYRPELLVMIQHTDEETGVVSEMANIQRCSDER